MVLTYCQYSIWFKSILVTGIDSKWVDIRRIHTTVSTEYMIAMSHFRWSSLFIAGTTAILLFPALRKQEDHEFKTGIPWIQPSLHQRDPVSKMEVEEGRKKGERGKEGERGERVCSCSWETCMMSKPWRSYQVSMRIPENCTSSEPRTLTFRRWTGRDEITQQCKYASSASTPIPTH